MHCIDSDENSARSSIHDSEQIRSILNKVGRYPRKILQQNFTNICAEFQSTSVLNSACRRSAVILLEFYVPTFCGFRPVFLHNSVTTLQYKDSTEMSVEFEMQIFRGIVGRHLIAQTRKNQKYPKNVGCRNVAENSRTLPV